MLQVVRTVLTLAAVCLAPGHQRCVNGEKVTLLSYNADPNSISAAPITGPPKQGAEPMLRSDYPWAINTGLVLNQDVKDLNSDTFSSIGLSVDTTVVNTVPLTVRENRAYLGHQRVYVPKAYLKAMHKMPRPSEPSEFNLNKPYLMGIFWVFGPFVIFSFLFLIISTVLFCRRAPKYVLKTTKSTNYCAEARGFLYILTFISALGGAGIAIWGTLVIRRGLKNVLESIRFASADLTGVYATTLNTKGSAGVVAASLNEIKALGNSALKIITYMNGMANVMNSVNHYIKFLYIIIFAFVTITMIAYFICVVFSPLFLNINARHNHVRAKLVRYMLLPLSLLVMIFAIVMLGVLIAASVVSGDFCVNPNATLLRQLTPIDGQFLNSYLYCSAANPYLQALEPVSIEVQKYRSTSNLLMTTWNTVCPKNTREKAEKAVKSFSTSIAQVTLLLNVVAPLAACPLIQGWYATIIYDNLCGSISYGLLLLWAGLVALVIGFGTAIWAFGISAMAGSDVSDDDFIEGTFPMKARLNSGA
eukprot:Ihof_evm11s37 gene=Ihof_evmTU11s37